MNTNTKVAIIIAGPVTALISFSACERDRRRERYRVIGRTNVNAAVVYEVPVVLEHDGRKYYARCNNVKAVENPKVTQHRELHVGMTVECQFFKNRETGYDLICGNKRDERGDLDTHGENELLTIDREEE